MLQMLLLVLPWRYRRLALQRLFSYRIDPSARIGLSIVAPRSLEMGPQSRIGHLNLVRAMDVVQLGESAIIGNLNWIYAIPTGAACLEHEESRRTEFIMQRHAALVSRHVVDCSSRVTLGPFSLVSGVRSLLMTHSVDLTASRQRSRPISIGAYSMTGSGCIVLGGAALPERSALGAGSTLRTAETEPLSLFSGVPAVAVRKLSSDALFFSRPVGAIDPGI